MSVKITETGPSLDSLFDDIRSFVGMSVTVGFQGSSGQQKAGDDSKLSVAGLAAVHEYGTDVVPARPFLRPAAEDFKGETVGPAIGEVIDGSLGGRRSSHLTSEKALTAIGKELLEDARRNLDRAELVDDDGSLDKNLSMALRRKNQMISSEVLDG